MTATTQTLADWLLEQIAADEARFDAAVAGEVEYLAHDGLPGVDPQEIRDLWLRPDSQSEWRYVLAVCAAHRAIVGLYALKWRKVTGRDALGEPVDPYDRGALRALERVLANLAQAFADRPGFREEWRA